MVRRWIIALLGLSVVCACSKSENDCDTAVSPEFNYKIGVQDSTGQSLIGALRTYHPDSIQLFAGEDLLPIEVYNVKGYYYVSFDYRGMQQYNNSVYALYLNHTEQDSFQLTVNDRDADCWSEYYIEQTIVHAETLQHPVDTLLLTK